MADEPKYPFADEFVQSKPLTSSVPRKPGRPKKEKVEPIPTNPSKLPFNARGRPLRTIDLGEKNYLQVAGAPVLPIEDFHPGCVCAVGQLLPDEVDVETVVAASRVGMHNKQIAALCNMSEDTLMLHFGKTIAMVKATKALDVLEIVSAKAAEGDMQAINMVLVRIEPKDTPAVVMMQPLPAHIIEMPAIDLTKQLKQLRNEKKD